MLRCSPKDAQAPPPEPAPVCARLKTEIEPNIFESLFVLTGPAASGATGGGVVAVDGACGVGDGAEGEAADGREAGAGGEGEGLEASMAAGCDGARPDADTARGGCSAEGFRTRSLVSVDASRNLGRAGAASAGFPASLRPRETDWAWPPL